MWFWCFAFIYEVLLKGGGYAELDAFHISSSDLTDWYLPSRVGALGFNVITGILSHVCPSKFKMCSFDKFIFSP